jgi:hypothetical protein
MIGIGRLQVFNNILIGETSDSKIENGNIQPRRNLHIWSTRNNFGNTGTAVQMNGRKIGLKPSMIQN